MYKFQLFIFKIIQIVYSHKEYDRRQITTKKSSNKFDNMTGKRRPPGLKGFCCYWGKVMKVSELRATMIEIVILIPENV